MHIAVLGIILWVTFIAAGFLAGLLLVLIPVEMLGGFGPYFVMVVQILCVGLVATFTLKYVR